MEGCRFSLHESWGSGPVRGSTKVGGDLTLILTLTLTLIRGCDSLKKLVELDLCEWKEMSGLRLRKSGGLKRH